MIEGDEWKDEEENRLSLAMARRYQEAKTVFLFRVRNGFHGMTTATIEGVSPNGKYVQLGSRSWSGGWLPLADIVILDVLVPFQKKDRQPKQGNYDEMLAYWESKLRGGGK